MAHAPISLGGGGGSGSDDCTATLDYVLEGKTAITKDSDDEPGDGRMKVNSLLSFSVAAYSGKRVLAIWKNPKAAKGRPYSGVYIRYSTSGSPGKTGGTQIYKGAGSNTAAEGQSQVYIDLPAANTKYYLSIYPYVTTSLGDITGAELNAEVTTEGTLNKTFASSQSFTIPEGYTKAKCFAVGGGAGGGKLSGGGGSVNYYAGGGGGGGYAGTSSEFAVSAGQILAIIVGAGGAVGTAGGTSGIADIFTKAGGNPPSSATTTLPGGGSGGSGGGAAGYSGSGSNGGNGGSNGGNGTTVYAGGGSGQGSTTKAWGNGTLYAGGGGGSGIGIIENGTSYGGSGGSGGGGNGGHRDGTSQSATSGGANTGGGGGGGRNSNYGKTCFSAAGGSGIVLLQLY